MSTLRKCFTIGRRAYSIPFIRVSTQTRARLSVVLAFNLETLARNFFADKEVEPILAVFQDKVRVINSIKISRNSFYAERQQRVGRIPA